MRIGDRAVLIVPALAALLGGLWGVRRGSMWQDEATTYAVAGRALPDLWRTLGNVDAVHGCYYLLLHPLIRLMGDAVPAEVVIRIPSVLATAAAAAGVAAVGRRLVSAPAGLYAGLAYAAAPVVVFHAQEGRPYALVAAAVVEATRLLSTALHDPSRNTWVRYGVTVAVACLLNLFAVLALAAHAVTVLVAAARGGGKGVAPRWACAAAAALLAVLPVVWTAFGQRGQVAWLERPGLPEVKALVTRFAGTGALLAATVVLVVLGLTTNRVGDLAGTVGRTPGGPGRLPGIAAFAVPLALLPPALLLAVSQIHPLYQDRYVLFSMAGLAMVLGAGLARAVRLLPQAAPGWVRAAAALALPALLLGASLPAQAAVRRIDSRPDDPAAVARIIGSQRRPGDAVLFLPSIRRLVAEAYPASFRGVRDAALRAGGAASGTLAGRELPAGEIAVSLGAAPRVWVVSRPHPAPADLSSSRDSAKRLLLRESYRRERTVRVLGYAVRLYTRVSP
ncbi:glycosyltransferase family 39 protein [Microbispora sp. NEAU-D428]|uniref:glycosyltransferase family 39 protein n=1 Tax=Microbispora sitophila TaxID=2771537 RepID=UPI001866D87F|nr:glycosyltransferase family 39 protein [Microbispora sitophila]MBE3013545.1 glycosyltransferase family 39 protein [Microbispora sitophila]